MSRFDELAKEWDLNPRRVKSAKSIADGIKKVIDIKDKKIADIGAGTGLLSFHLFEEACCIDAIDNSKGMLEKLDEKSKQLDKKIHTIFLNIEKENLPKKYDIIVSSMTMHHIKDIENFIKKCKDALSIGGYLAIADLVTEDGTFHSRGNEGVEHFGFYRDELVRLFEKIGFEVVSYKIVEKIQKHRDFEVFLIIARKRD